MIFLTEPQRTTASCIPHIQCTHRIGEWYTISSSWTRWESRYVRFPKRLPRLNWRYFSFDDDVGRCRFSVSVCNVAFFRAHGALLLGFRAVLRGDLCWSRPRRQNRCLSVSGAHFIHVLCLHKGVNLHCGGVKKKRCRILIFSSSGQYSTLLGMCCWRHIQLSHKAVLMLPRARTNASRAHFHHGTETCHADSPLVIPSVSLLAWIAAASYPISRPHPHPCLRHRMVLISAPSRMYCNTPSLLRSGIWAHCVQT